jgi:hypothetical protein
MDWMKDNFDAKLHQWRQGIIKSQTDSELSGIEPLSESETETKKIPPKKHLFDITFDNVNQRINTRYHTREKSSTILNMVQAYAT